MFVGRSNLVLNVTVAMIDTSFGCDVDTSDKVICIGPYYADLISISHILYQFFSSEAAPKRVKKESTIHTMKFMILCTIWLNKH